MLFLQLSYLIIFNVQREWLFFNIVVELGFLFLSETYLFVVVDVEVGIHFDENVIQLFHDAETALLFDFPLPLHVLLPRLLFFD